MRHAPESDFSQFNDPILMEDKIQAVEWQLGGFAVDPPTVSGTFTDMSGDQLVQAMAGFGGDAADDSNSVFLGDDTSQQPLLTTPQQA